MEVIHHHLHSTTDNGRDYCVIFSAWRNWAIPRERRSMGVAAPLFGCGPLSGFASADDLSFTVKSSIGKITFKGHRTNASISGAYWVEHEDRPNEEGTFTLQKGKSRGPRENFDPAKCPSDAEIHQ
jgi:hypothetical protein